MPLSEQIAKYKIGEPYYMQGSNPLEPIGLGNWLLLTLQLNADLTITQEIVQVLWTTLYEEFQSSRILISAHIRKHNRIVY